MYKWAIYTCIWYMWWWWEEYQWEFEVITLTDKTCKLKRIKEWTFNYLNLKDNILYFRSKNNMKDFIKEEFVKYRTDCGKPFKFTIQTWKSL